MAYHTVVASLLAVVEVVRMVVGLASAGTPAHENELVATLDSKNVPEPKVPRLSTRNPQVLAASALGAPLVPLDGVIVSLPPERVRLRLVEVVESCKV